MPVAAPALGRRGEGWVALQSIVIAGIVVCAVLGPGWPHGGEPWLRIAGFLLIAIGLAMFVAATVTLGRSLTPLPRPRDDATLRHTGLYARVRHPIYGALLVTGVGVSLDRSPLVFAPTAVLAVVFTLKSIREEAWLTERYPGYADYRRATPRRFVPWVF